MRADAGVVISASHNPYQDNGIKFFSGDGFKLPDEIEAHIESLMTNPEVDGARPTALTSARPSASMMPGAVTSLISRALSPRKWNWMA